MTIRFGDQLDDTAAQPAEFHGTLRTWMSAQHYGFIARDDRQPDIFVHGSALLAAGIAEPEVDRAAPRVPDRLRSLQRPDAGHERHGRAVMNLASIPIADAARLVAKLNAGDAEAREFFSSLFPDGSVCWLCDRAIGGRAVVTVLPDPKNPKQALLAPTLHAAAWRCPTGASASRGCWRLCGPSYGGRARGTRWRRI